MELITTIVSVLGGSAAAIATAGWLASKFFENRLNRDIETFKANIKAESDVGIESLKSRLQVSAKEREIAVTWAHQKRASAIETLYSALVDLQHSIRMVLDIFSPRNPQDIRRYTSEAVAKSHEAYTSYLKAKIFMSPMTCEKIERVLQGLQDPVVTYNLYLANYEDDELHTLADVKQQSWKDLLDCVPSALTELETEFRKVLGVEAG